MRKFECDGCGCDCKLETGDELEYMLVCVQGLNCADWREVISAENAQTTQQFGNSELLPDWVKVREWGYKKSTNQYFIIIGFLTNSIRVNYFPNAFDAFISNKDIIDNCTEARKRPFNDKEMKALVGKVVRGDKFDFCALITYAEAETIETQHFTYTSDELINDYTIDGKPCYVLEHLENGEWVE